MIKFNCYELYAENTNSIKSLRSISGYVSYRIHKIGTDRNYSGHAKDLYNRLFNKLFGHLTAHLRPDDECDYVHLCMKYDGYENFDIYIEAISDTLDKAKKIEAEIAEKYECFTKGYNRTQTGNGGPALGSKVILNPNTGECKYIEPNENISEYESNGWINTNKTKGTLTLISPTGKIVMVHPDTSLYESYINEGYTNLSWKGSVWIKNLSNGRYHHLRDEVYASELISSGEYIYEAPTKGLINVFDNELGKFRKISENEYNSNLDRYTKSSIYSGSKMMINPSTGDIRKVYHNELVNFELNGYIPYVRSGKVTLFNPITGSQTCTYDTSKISLLLSQNWIKGKCNHGGFIIMNNGYDEIKIPKSNKNEVNHRLEIGYIYGKLNA